jgi:hypothetical protein
MEIGEGNVVVMDEIVGWKGGGGARMRRKSVRYESDGLNRIGWVWKRGRSLEQ